ncbi:MAG: hypothetical protein ACE5F1_14685 [Planctomycetota bacterium]
MAAILLSCCATLSLLSPQDPERRTALANRTHVPTASPAQVRRVQEGLRLLREGKGKDALNRIHLDLRSAAQVPWGPRETRQLHEILRDHLALASPGACRSFLADLEEEATRAMAHLALEKQALLRFLRDYPATSAAGMVRQMLVDQALERGDWVLASRHVDELEARRRKPRLGIITRLRDRSLHRSPWPYPSGTASGEAGIGAAVAPRSEKPVALGLWSSPVPSLQPALTRGVVGRGSDGEEIAVFQDPWHLYRVDSARNGFHPRMANLEALTSLPGGGAVRPSPSLLGEDLYIVHGGDGGPFARRLFGAPDRAKRPELFAFCCSKGDKPFELRWRWSPPKKNDESSAPWQLLPQAFATGRRIFALCTQEVDRVTTKVFAVCLSGRGRLLWSSYVAKGAPLSQELLEHRQEALRKGTHRPAPMILARGRLIVPTGLGILAALDPDDGAILWTFRYARLEALGTKDSPWEEGRLSSAGELLFFAPSDGSHFYRLRLDPGLADILVEPPMRKRSLARYFGYSRPEGANYFYRRGQRESGPLRILRDPDPARPRRHDATPVQPEESLSSGALLTTKSLLLATSHSIYWVDLAKDLFYEDVIELDTRRHPLGFGPIVPFQEGVLIAGSVFPVLWR